MDFCSFKSMGSHRSNCLNLQSYSGEMKTTVTNSTWSGSIGFVYVRAIIFLYSLKIPSARDTLQIPSARDCIDEVSPFKMLVLSFLHTNNSYYCSCVWHSSLSWQWGILDHFLLAPFPTVCFYELNTANNLVPVNNFIIPSFVE